jgi:hypothetical protein
MKQPIAALLVVAALLLPAGSRAQAPDPSPPGPLPVSSVEYEFDDVSVADIPYLVDVWAVVWYPTGLPGGPYPLAVFLHGNHGVCRDSGGFDNCPSSPPHCPSGEVKTPNHRGYDYIAQRLAGYGYIVVSINANAINCRGDGIPERGRLVQEHLRRWRGFNDPGGAAPFGTQFSGKVDLDDVGLMGHSRGGEGVRAGYQFNRTDPDPFGIRGVIEIGPVDFHATDADNVPWSVVLPACDGDVSDLEGVGPFDRAQFIPETNKSPKALQLVWGAIHNFFNSEWDQENFSCFGQVLLTRPQEEQAGRVYVMGFMRTFLGNENFGDLFTHDVSPPLSVPTRVDNAYTESPSAIFVVDNFTAPGSPFVNDAGGANVFTNLTVTRCSGFACGSGWNDDPSEVAVRVGWTTSAAGAFTADLAPGSAPHDVSGFGFLSLRVSEQQDARNPPSPGSQNFTVRLVDGNGAVSVGVAADAFKDIHPAIGPFGPNPIPETLRIPLAAFAGVDLTAIRRVRIEFDQEPDGALFVSNIAFDPIPVAGRGSAQFICDRARNVGPAFAVVPGVHMVDDFEDAAFDLIRPARLCNPASIDERPAADPKTHLEAYIIRPSAGSSGVVPHRFVRVLDEVGTLVVDLVKPELLLVPSSRDGSVTLPPPNPSAHNVSHYKCYRVKRSKGSAKFPRGLQLTRSDELTTSPKIYDIVRPIHLCRGVSADGSVIKNPETQLTCYQVKAAVGQPRFNGGINVFTNNEFGDDIIGPVRDDEICVPSKKNPQ